ncbi:MAG: DUF3500 domain-containing protein [Desulfobulbaceae bacterium]|nr:DUF3500 domain-containing protein [Desulfobulbaceae bacterium]
MHLFHGNNRMDMAAAPQTAKQMVLTATAFLGSLEDEQRRQVVWGVNEAERYTWDYRPVPRQGLSFAEMDSGQQLRACALLASGLSREGTITALGIMSLEKILGDLEGSSMKHQRNPEQYFVTIFGEPASNEAWGWRIEGHHLSLNFLIVGGRSVACTPNFFGANPAKVPEGPLAGFRTLPIEEDAARQLVAAFDVNQSQQAVISDTAPPDIITRWDPHVRLDDPAGIAAAALQEDQRHLLLRLIDVYLGRMTAEVADNQMDAIDCQGIGAVHFAWAGSRTPGTPHYYRLHGPHFLVEYDNTQNNANHIHSVWRDFERDWGKDLLREHFAAAHSG